MKQRFVSPRKDPQGGHQWAIKLAGASRAAAIVKGKEKALEIARDMAIRNKEELVAQRVNGKIHLKNSYGNDPSSIPG